MLQSGYDHSDGQMSKDVKRKIEEAINRSGDKNLTILYFIATSIFFFYFVFGPLLPRLFLRTKMGVRTYGVISIFVTYFWVKFFYITTIFYQLDESEFPYGSDINAERWIYIIVGPFMEFGNFLIGGQADDFAEGDYGQYILPFKFSVFGFESLLPYIALLVPIAAIFQLKDRFSKSQYSVSTYYRGNSILFSWLKKFGVSDFQILALIEPTFLFLLGLLARFFNDFSFGIALQFVSICLLFSELKAWFRIRSILMNMSDAQKESDFMMSKNEEIRKNSPSNSSHPYLGSNDNLNSDSNSGKASMD